MSFLAERAARGGSEKDCAIGNLPHISVNKLNTFVAPALFFFRAQSFPRREALGFANFGRGCASKLLTGVSKG